jgi:two-component system cell cycle response regulator DivK
MRPRILVVEDNPLNRELLCDWLEVEGYEVLGVPDLQGAFTLIKNYDPDAVLLDVQLGADDGLQLASWIREQPALRHMPVIAVTAQAMVNEQQRILESGCDNIVSKPIDFKILREQLQICLRRPADLQANRVPGK